MNIKKYRAKSIKHGLEIVRNELGPDAVILSTKEIEGGKAVEILAASDYHKPVGQGDGDPWRHGDVETGTREHIPTDTTLEHRSSIEQELIEVKQGIEKLLKWVKCSEIHDFSSLYYRLLGAGVGTENAVAIANTVGEKLHSDELHDEAKLKEEIGTLIPTEPIRLKTKPAVVAFVGPTGTGKTTTIAKLSANFTLFDKLKSALVTIDTYRIAAVEQLKTFADIVNIPIEVAISPEDFTRSIEKHKEANVIFVDTAGGSQKNEKYIKELMSFFKVVRPTEVHLVVSLTTKSSLLCDIIDKFSVLNPDKLIFTKLDETAEFGGILEGTYKMNKPVSYLTTGQSVPDDIERADSMKIAHHIIENKEIWER